jgi:hypothetical protein
MATIGQALTTPESGWRRYDQTDSRILYTNGTWTISNANSPAYNGSQATSNNINATCSFKFNGSKLRLIGTKDSSYSSNIEIYIDDILCTSISESYTSNIFQILLFEKLDLSIEIHTIKIINKTSSYLVIDAIDIDNTGYLVHPILNQVSDINSMQIGDCIPCRYTASTSGSAGYFSEIGTCIANEIPVAGTATPNGLFYFIKVKKGKLIADRVIQTGINWDTLNAAKYIEGTNIKNNITPILTSNISNSDFLVNCSSVWSTNGAYEAYKAFDNYTNSYWSPTGLTGWLQCKFVTQARIVTRYRIDSISSYSPKSWTFEGSNDGTNWTILDNVVNNSTFDVLIKDIYNNIKYNYYKINISASNSGSYIYINELKLYENSNYYIRSLSGGCVYLDANNNPSLTNQNLGAWPPTNEWDTYIVKSDLNGKIVPGDDNIWHWGKWSVCKETSNNGMIYSGVSGTNTRRIARGAASVNTVSHGLSNYTAANFGFRPVLNYVESDIVSEVIY